MRRLIVTASALALTVSAVAEPGARAGPASSATCCATARPGRASQARGSATRAVMNDLGGDGDNDDGVATTTHVAQVLLAGRDAG